MELQFLSSNSNVDLVFVKEMGGTNGAKLYSSKSPDLNYVIKFYDNPADSYNEVLTGKLYELFGVNVPDVSLVFDAGNQKYGVASKYIESFKTANEKPLTEAQKKELRITGVIHAWLNNWDFVGLQNDNIGTCNADNNERVLLSFDHRCGLNGRGLPLASEGHTKREHYGVEAFDSVVRSLTSLRNPNQNKQTAEFLKDTSEEEIKEGIQKIAHIPEKDIRDCIKQYGFGTEEDKQQLVATMLARRNYLMMKYFIFNNEINKNTEFEEIANLIVNAFYCEAADGDNGYKNEFCNQKQLDDKSIEHIKRVKHGGMHVSRVAALVNVFFNLYKIYDTRTDLLDDEKLKMLMITAMFHDAGRRHDSGDDSAEDEERSAQLAKECLLSLGYDENLSHVISLAIKYKDKKDKVSQIELPKIQDPAKSKNDGYVQQLLDICIDFLHDADCLDVLRANDWVFDPKYLTFHQKFIKVRREVSVEREEQDAKHYQEFIDHTEKRLDEIIAAHANALVSMGDCPQGYKDEDKNIDIAPCFSLETKVIYENANKCYSNIASALCQQPVLAKNYTEFVSFIIQSEGKACADLGEKIIRYDMSVDGFELLSQEYKHDSDAGVSGKTPDYDDIGQYFADEGNLDPTIFIVRNNVLVIRNDYRPPGEIKAVGGFNPLVTLRKCTYVIDGREAGVKFDCSSIPVLSVSEHRRNVHNNSGFVSFSFSKEAYSKPKMNSYIVFARMGVSYVSCGISQSVNEHVDEHELSVPGGVAWGDVLAYRDGDKIYVRKSIFAENTDIFAEELLRNLLRKNEEVICSDSADEGSLISVVRSICRKEDPSIFCKVNYILVYNQRIRARLREMSHLNNSHELVAVFIRKLVQVAVAYATRHENIITYNNELVELILFSGEKLMFSQELFDLLESTNDFVCLCKCIDINSFLGEKSRSLAQSKLHELVSNAKTLTNVIGRLSVEQARVILDLIGDLCLSELVSDVIKLTAVLRRLNAELGLVFLEIIGSLHLRGLVAYEQSLKDGWNTVTPKATLEIVADTVLECSFDNSVLMEELHTQGVNNCRVCLKAIIDRLYEVVSNDKGLADKLNSINFMFRRDTLDIIADSLKGVEFAEDDPNIGQRPGVLSAVVVGLNELLLDECKLANTRIKLSVGEFLDVFIVLNVPICLRDNISGNEQLVEALVRLDLGKEHMALEIMADRLYQVELKYDVMLRSSLALASDTSGRKILDALMDKLTENFMTKVLADIYHKHNVKNPRCVSCKLRDLLPYNFRISNLEPPYWHALNTLSVNKDCMVPNLVGCALNNMLQCSHDLEFSSGCPEQHYAVDLALDQSGRKRKGGPGFFDKSCDLMSEKLNEFLCVLKGYI